jgi:DNA-binding transcriptional LysR family regulator
VPDALVLLRRAHPRLRVHVAAGMSADLARRVSAGDLDAAITTEPVRPHPPDLAWNTLYEDRFWILAPPEHEGRGLRDLLRDLPFIRFDAQAWAGRMIARELRRLGVDVQEEMALDSQEVIVRMVASGLGVAVVMLPDGMLPDLPPLARRPFGEPQMRRPVVLLERQGRPAQRFARALAEAVRAASMRNSQGKHEN